MCQQVTASHCKEPKIRSTKTLLDPWDNRKDRHMAFEKEFSLAQHYTSTIAATKCWNQGL